MMRKFYFIIMALVIAGSSFAQQSLRDYSAARVHRQNNTTATPGTRSVTAYQINEDFNGPTFPPTDWTVQSLDGGSGWESIDVGTTPLPGWTGDEATDHTGATIGKIAYCTYTTGGSAANDQWLITPQVAISNGDLLNFWMRRAFTYVDNVDILLSTTGNATSDFTVTLDNLTWNATASDWTEYNYDLSAYDGQSVYVAFREHVADNYNDGAAIFLDDLKIGSPEPWDAALTYLTMDPYVLVGNVDVTGTIKNFGQNEITDIDITWSDGTNQYTDNLTGLSIAAGGSYNFTHSTQLNVATATEYNISAWITLANDANTDNDSASTTLAGVTSIPTKKVVGEEAGGTWCGWCVRGIVSLKDMKHNYPDTWIGIGVHNGDPMVVANYDGSMNVSGYPSGYVDRDGGETDPGDFETAYADRVNMVAPAGVEVINTVWDPNTNTITFDVKASFVTELNGDFRLNAVITEDNVTSTASGWEQHNYYSSATYDIDLIDWEGINYRNLTDPIPAADMVYDEVARAILGDFDGTSGSVPASVAAGDVATYSYSYVVPSDQKAEDMHLIGFLVDQTSGEILNADMVESPYFVGVASIENSSINIFPNPSTGVINVKGAENSTIEVLNSLGQVVLTVNNASNMEYVNLSAYNEGTYIVRVITNNNITVKKVNIVK